MAWRIVLMIVLSFGWHLNAEGEVAEYVSCFSTSTNKTCQSKTGCISALTYNSSGDKEIKRECLHEEITFWDCGGVDLTRQAIKRRYTLHKRLKQSHAGSAETLNCLSMICCRYDNCNHHLNKHFKKPCINSLEGNIL